MGFVIMMFHKPFLSKITLALPIKDVEGKVINYNGKCYSYRAEDRACEILSSK